MWIFEPEQLIRVILSRPSDEVVRERDEIVAELSNATQSLVIIDEIRYHTDDSGYKNGEWLVGKIDQLIGDFFVAKLAARN